MQRDSCLPGVPGCISNARLLTALSAIESIHTAAWKKNMKKKKSVIAIILAGIADVDAGLLDLTRVALFFAFLLGDKNNLLHRAGHEK